MVKLREVLEKLGPDFGFPEDTLEHDVGDIDFDGVYEVGGVYDYVNSKEPNIRLRIIDDFPFRVMTFYKKDDVLYIKSFNGVEVVEYIEKDNRRIKLDDRQKFIYSEYLPYKYEYPYKPKKKKIDKKKYNDLRDYLDE